MNENNEPPPTKLLIMPDYDSTYAWDEDGTCMGLDDFFPNHPQLEEIVKLDQKMEVWASWYWDVDDELREFPWAEFYDHGLMLAKRLVELVKDSDIPIVYCCARDKSRDWSEKLVLAEGKKQDERSL